MNQHPTQNPNTETTSNGFSLGTIVWTLAVLPILPGALMLVGLGVGLHALKGGSPDVSSVGGRATDPATLPRAA